MRNSSLALKCGVQFSQTISKPVRLRLVYLLSTPVVKREPATVVLSLILQSVLLHVLLTLHAHTYTYN